MNRPTIILWVISALLIILAGALWFTLRDTETRAFTEITKLSENLVTTKTVLATTQSRVSELESLLTETQQLLQDAVDENDSLERSLRREKNRNDEFEEQIEKIGSAVGTLDKLAKTDKQLLQKYSKVYFLNEHYMPPRLREIDKDFVYRSGGDPEFIHAQVEPFLTKMLTDARDDGVKLWVVSAFRSFDTQRTLKGAYTVTYGSGANTFSADQGYSEHQLGTTLDFTTEGLGGGLTNFQTTAAYEWLLKNAHKYGFVMSYPPNNAYYIFEPWHWRFVGTELARNLHNAKKFFYDLDQREIDEYLISLFD